MNRRADVGGVRYLLVGRLRAGRATGVATLAALTGLCMPVAAPAQQARALSKSELVRLVVTDTYTTDEKVQVVRGACLSFEPTEGDWADLRNLGAAQALVDAVRDCVWKSNPLVLSLSARWVIVTAGDGATLTATVRRADVPVAGLALTLASAGGGSGARVSATTDAAGRARFRVPARTTAGTSRYSISAGRQALEGPTTVEIVTTAAAPSRVRLSPTELDADPTRQADTILVAVTDAFGNAAAEVALRLTGAEGPEAESVLAQEATNERGEARLIVERLRLEGLERDSLYLQAAGRTLTIVPVRRPLPEGPELAAGAVPAADARPGGPEGAQAGAAAEPIAETDPVATSLDAVIAAGQASLREGDAATAEERFREALRLAPRRIEAQKGLAAATLAQGKTDAAILWYEVAVRQNSADADAWEGLGTAYRAAGRREDARAALSRARELDPSRAEDLGGEVAILSRPPGYVEASAWGGGTLASENWGGLRRAELVIGPSPAISLWAGYDRSLGPRSPELVRGPDDWDALFGGTRLRWGPARRLATEVEFGQRDQGFDLKENVIRLTQSVRLSEGSGAPTISLGGFLGRWFDRDDWIAFSRLAAGVGQDVTVSASLSYGETIGTNFAETGRHADRDGRLYLGLGYEPPGGLSIQPRIGIGRISSDREELSGTLLDLMLEAAVPIVRGSRALLFVRHQRPPGSESFTVIAGGLSLHFGWAGG